MAETISSYIHEINNPLGNIYMLAQAIELETDMAATRQYVELLKQSVQQVKNIQADYNEYRKTGKNSVKPNIVNVGSLISEVVNEYRPQAAKKNIRLVLNVKQGRIFTDIVKFKQIISNLVSNAIKYNTDDGAVYISCSSGKELGSVEITIKDTGIGMTEAELKLIGTPFYRCKRVETNGTGLGFSLIKKLTDMLGWRLKVSSDIGVGTTVVLFV